MNPPDHARIDQEYWRFEFDVREDPAVLEPLPEPREEEPGAITDVAANPFDAVCDFLCGAWFDIEHLFW